MSSVYDQARRFLLAARPNDTEDAASQFRRRIPVSPYAVLEGPISLAMFGGDGDTDGDDDGGGGDPGCAYNLDEVTSIACGALTIIIGDASCEPPYISIAIDAIGGQYAVRWDGNSTFTCGTVSTVIVSVPGGEFLNAGVWAGGTQPSEGVSALFVQPDTVVLQELGVTIASFSPVAYPAPGGLALSITEDGDVEVQWNGTPIINATVAPLVPGYGGVVGFSKGHNQTLRVRDCRCE